MKTFSTIGLVVLSACALTVNGFAVPGAGLQAVFDGFTVNPAGNSSVDVTTDFIAEGSDDYWAITGTGGSVETVVIELGSFAGFNKFGIYDAANSANKVQVFSGAAGAGSQAIVSIKADGSVFVNLVDTGIDFAGNNFGFYLDSSAEDGTPTTPPSGGIFYSDTSLNTDGQDHMFAYAGKDTDTIQLPGHAAGLWTDNEFALGWEDLYGGGDKDYDDFVVMIESINPVPDGGTSIALLGLALTGLAGVSRFGRKSVK